MLFAASYAVASLAAFVAASDGAQVPLTATISEKLELNSTLKMNSGHYIPLLGFGVWQTYDILGSCTQPLWNRFANTCAGLTIKLKRLLKPLSKLATDT